MGKWGEAQAGVYLRKKGYELLAANYRSRFGEIDIIAKKDSFVVFVEVKQRKNDVFAQAQEAVTYKKQQRIKATAELWLSTEDSQLQPRFDVIEVYGGMNTEPKINHIENAF